MIRLSNQNQIYICTSIELTTKYIILFTKKKKIEQVFRLKRELEICFQIKIVYL